MAPLFLFGTLRHPPLLEAVLGATAHLTLTPAALPDHAVCAAAEGPYPVLVPRPGARAEGTRVDGLTAEDHARLDAYETPFGYDLAPVTLEGGVEAVAFMAQPGRVTAQGAWSLSDWARDWGAIAVPAAEELMTYRAGLGAEDIARVFPMMSARAWSRQNAAHSRHGEGTLRGRVEVLRRERPYADYFAVEEYHLSHERFDGSMTGPVRRAVFLAPDAALVLPYDPLRDRVLLVEQMRMGPLARGDGPLWQLEPVAGRLDPGETPEAAARREALEEAGLSVGRLEPVAECYCSPGNSTEFYYIFVGIADLPDSAAGLGGLDAEHEDIRAHLVSFERLMALCEACEIANAPLVLAAYWLARHRSRLRGEG